MITEYFTIFIQMLFRSAVDEVLYQTMTSAHTWKLPQAVYV